MKKLKRLMQTASLPRLWRGGLAKDSGVDLAGIQGSGPHGRIVAADVEAAKSRKGVIAPAAAEGAAPAGHGMSDQQIRALYPDDSYEIVPHDSMRRIIAQRLVQSNLTIPHFYLTVDCDIGKLLAAREESNRTAPQDKDGKPVWKLSVNDFVIKALALALQRVPDANATWTESGMLKHKHSDVGVAVAIKGGLIAPLVRNAETKSLVGHLQRDEGIGRARSRAQAETRGIFGRRQCGLQSRHVRHQGFHRGDQSAAGDHSRGRRRRGASRRALRQDRDRHDHDGDAFMRPPRRRRRARRAAHRRL